MCSIINISIIFFHFKLLYYASLTSPSKDAERTRHCSAFYYSWELGTVYQFPRRRVIKLSKKSQKYWKWLLLVIHLRVTSYLAESFLSYVIIFYLATHFWNGQKEKLRLFCFLFQYQQIEQYRKRKGSQPFRVELKLRDDAVTSHWDIEGKINDEVEVYRSSGAFNQKVSLCYM